MNVLISGASGMVGTALSEALKAERHRVTILTRGNAGEGQVFWDPLKGALDSAALTGIDAVVHLAGENIAGRWTASKKKAIRDSRILGTQTLSNALLNMNTPPKVMICASAIGYYGNRGDEMLTESSAAGTGFLPEVCKDWEAASAAVEKAGIRRVLLRIGVILSTKGGALAKMLTPFKMGVGGVIGSGTQYMSWISLNDVIGAILFALNNQTLSGPVNLVAPNAATNREFTKTLGKVLGRPTIFPMPAFAAKLLFGEMANDLLLGSTRVKPERLAQAGYAFMDPQLEEAFEAVVDNIEAAIQG